jgi:hypothetical protein
LRCPLALPAGDQAPCLFVLTEARFHPGPPVVGVGASARGEVGHRRHPYRLWVAPLVLGRPHAPLPRRATATVGLQDGGDLAAGARRRRPGPQGLTALPPPASGAALGDDLRVSTAYPVQDRRGAPTPIETEHHALPPLPRPAPPDGHLAARRLQGRPRRGLAPQPGLRQHCAVRTRRPPSDCPPGLAAGAPQPGALTAFGVGPNGQRGDLDIAPPQALGAPVGGGLAVALQGRPRPPAEWRNRRRGTRRPRARHGRWRRTARPSQGPLHGGSEAKGAMTLRHGFGAPADPSQPIEPCIDRTIADRFLWHRPLCPPRGKATLPFAIRAQGTQAGTARRPQALFGPKRTPCWQGDVPPIDPLSPRSRG